MTWSLNINNSSVEIKVTSLKKKFPVTHIHYRKRIEKTDKEKQHKTLVILLRRHQSCKHSMTIYYPVPLSCWCLPALTRLLALSLSPPPYPPPPPTPLLSPLSSLYI